MKHRTLATVVSLVLLATAPACPRPAPGPETPAVDAAGPEPTDATAPETADALEPPPPGPGDAAASATVPDPRFGPLVPGASARPTGTSPAIEPTTPPEGDRSPAPDIGEAARTSLQAQFGCQFLGELPWPAAWLSPAGVVLKCCRPVTDGAVPEDAFVEGCMMPFACSLLIDEGIGAVTEVKTIMELRRRVAPVREAATALAFVDATVRDVVPFFGDTEQDRRFVLEGTWNYVAESIRGTRVTGRLGAQGGWNVTTFVRRGCTCRHDLEEVTFEVTDLAGLTETSRRVVIEDTSGVCVD
jgi:hypothetical protein